MTVSISEKSGKLGSQRLLQRAVEHRPDLLLKALRKAGALDRGETVEWTSPLKNEEYKEYQDAAALKKLGVAESLVFPLKEFWPKWGPVWDGTGISSKGRPLLLEAKAHIPEAASPGSEASPKSLALIEASLSKAKKYYSPRNNKPWSGTFYQYANRLAHHYYLRDLNDIPSILIFLDFVNATDMDGPNSALEWKGATRLIHEILGLPSDLEKFGVFHVYVDANDVIS